MRAIPDEHEVPPVGVTRIYAYTADHGVRALGGAFVARQQAVADLMQSWGAQWYLFGGDNNYPDGAASTIASNWTPWATQITAESVFPAFGNHDWDSITGSDLLTAAQFAKFPYLDQDHAYYVQSDDLVSVYFLNSGLNTDGDLIEPAGNDIVSEQREWLIAQIAASTSQWHIVVIHHPGWTSSTDHYPGTPATRWDWRSLGIDLVLSGHGHNYERQLIDRTSIVVAGNGGNDLHSFVSTPVDGSLVRLSFYGALRLTVTGNTLDLDAIETNGFVRDRLNLFKDRLITGGQSVDLYQYIVGSGSSPVPPPPPAPSSPSLYAGTGSPEGVQTAAEGSIYFDLTTPESPVQYIKTTDGGNTGWV